MFETFVLYDTLYEQFKNETSFDAIDQLVIMVKQLDPLGLQVAGALIQKHSNNPDVVPYEGKTVGQNAAKFDMRNFDPILQHILLEFSKRHIIKMSEQKTTIKPIGNGTTMFKMNPNE
jgi:hypothetical protein